MSDTPNYYIGLMSGTSMDGIDAALVSFENKHTNLLGTTSIAIPEKIKSDLLLLCHGKNISLKLLGETDKKLGELYSEAVLTLLKNTEIKSTAISAIGSHGQTIYHSPNGEHPFTMQIGDANIIAARTHITTVADFRRRDMAHGGQGAPLAPAFHAYLFGCRDRGSGIGDQIVLNLGGIANITHISADKSKPIIGFDTGPANTLLDQWCQKHTGQSFDKNGEWARSGKLNTDLLSQLLDDDYFKKPFPKSTGREYFNLSWLDTALKRKDDAVNIQTTLTELTAKTISDAINRISKNKSTLWLCGGGAYNSFLIERIQKNCGHCEIKSTTEIGIDPQWIEAAAFAWLAKQTIEHKSGNLPSVTGAKKETILGGIYFY